MKTYTITFGDVAENHARMQKIGELHSHGYSTDCLLKVKAKLESKGVECEMHDLSISATGAATGLNAYVLVIRKGAQYVLGGTDDLIKENDALEVDKFAKMRGKVVNKRARWNLCFSDIDQEPDYENSKGRIVAWRHVPLLSKLREKIAEWTDDVLLNGEGNYYYDISKCGIGYHGDAERRKVFAVRMGASMDLYFQWFLCSKPIGERIGIQLNDGDMYMMNEKAVGFDWLKKLVPTLRHSTGCKKYVELLF